MYINKVEICGVNTSKLTVLKEAEKVELLKRAKAGDEAAREELIQTYPNPLYEGETADPQNQSAYPKTFAEPLTFELFQQHQALSERAKG